MTTAQIMIALLGVSAVWLVGCTGRAKRWGYVCGLCAQPFWLYETITHGQYPIAVLCAFYGFSWARGAWKNWNAHKLLYAAEIVRARLQAGPAPEAARGAPAPPEGGQG